MCIVFCWNLKHLLPLTFQVLSLVLSKHLGFLCALKLGVFLFGSCLWCFSKHLVKGKCVIIWKLSAPILLISWLTRWPGGPIHTLPTVKKPQPLRHLPLSLALLNLILNLWCFYYVLSWYSDLISLTLRSTHFLSSLSDFHEISFNGYRLDNNRSIARPWICSCLWFGFIML